MHRRASELTPGPTRRDGPLVGLRRPHPPYFLPLTEKSMRASNRGAGARRRRGGFAGGDGSSQLPSTLQLANFSSVTPAGTPKKPIVTAENNVVTPEKNAVPAAIPAALAVPAATPAVPAATPAGPAGPFYDLVEEYSRELLKGHDGVVASIEDILLGFAEKIKIKGMEGGFEIDFEIDFEQAARDRVFTAAAMTIGTAYLFYPDDDLEEESVETEGAEEPVVTGASGGSGVTGGAQPPYKYQWDIEEEDALLQVLRTGKTMEAITIAIEKFVTDRDSPRSAMIGMDAQSVLPLIRSVLVTVAAAGDEDEHEHEIFIGPLGEAETLKATREKLLERLQGHTPPVKTPRPKTLTCSLLNALNPGLTLPDFYEAPLKPSAVGAKILAENEAAATTASEASGTASTTGSPESPESASTTWSPGPASASGSPGSPESPESTPESPGPASASTSGSPESPGSPSGSTPAAAGSSDDAAACEVPRKRVTYANMDKNLRRMYTPSLTEVLLYNIINKTTYKHAIYNACYLYCVNTNENFLNVEGWVVGRIPAGDEGRPPKNGSRQQIVEESESIIRDGWTKDGEENFPVPGKYAAFPPIPDLLIHEVVQGALLAYAYSSLGDLDFETAKSAIEKPGFAWTLSAFTRILPSDPCRYSNGTQRDIGSTVFSRKSSSDQFQSTSYDLYYLDAHGRLTCEMGIGKADESGGDVVTDTVIVPDNVVIVKIGIVGEKSHALWRNRDYVLKQICGGDIHNLALRTELRGLGCDIVPPGYPVSNMILKGDEDVIKDGKFVRKAQWTGIVDCTNSSVITMTKGHETKLSDTIEALSDSASESGRMALFVMVACQTTLDRGLKSASFAANDQAFRRLPPRINYFNLDGKLRVFNVHRVIRQSAAMRLRNPILMRDAGDRGELWYLAEQGRRERKRKRELIGVGDSGSGSGIGSGSGSGSEGRVSDGLVGVARGSASGSARGSASGSASATSAGGGRGTPRASSVNYGLTATLFLVTVAMSLLGRS